MSTYIPGPISESFTAEEIEKLRDIKKKAVKLFGHGGWICDKCGSPSSSVYAANGNATTMKKCSDSKCKNSSAIRQKGWTDYLLALSIYQYQL